MTSRIWQLAGVGLLGLGISLGALAEGPGDPGPGRPLNARDEVRQTQPPRQGYYQDIPRRHGDEHRWQAGGRGQGPVATGRGARTAMAMAGGRGRSTALGTRSIVSLTATGKCPIAAVTTSTPAVTGTARMAAITSW